MNKNTVTLDLMLPDFKGVAEENKNQAISDFFIQVQGVLIGAVVCLPANTDFKLKLNYKKIVEKVELPEVLLKKLKANNNILSIVDVVSGDGKIFQ